VVCVVLHAGAATVTTVLKDAVDGLDFRGTFVASTGTRRMTGRNAYLRAGNSETRARFTFAYFRSPERKRAVFHLHLAVVVVRYVVVRSDAESVLVIHENINKLTNVSNYVIREKWLPACSLSVHVLSFMTLWLLPGPMAHGKPRKCGSNNRLGKITIFLEIIPKAFPKFLSIYT